jgi:hypothetical protein
MAARTTHESANRAIREKNDMEVFFFYCVAIHHIDTRFVPVKLHTEEFSN